MKKMKKLLSMLLALIMVLAMAAPSFAEQGRDDGTGTSGSIVISNAIKEQTYKVYKIFDVESFDTTEGNYSYKIADGWAEFFQKSEIKPFFTIVDGYVTEVKIDAAFDNVNAKLVAEKAFAYIEENGISATKEGKVPGPIATNEETATLTIDGLSYGYYLVDSSTGALCSLGLTNPTARITDKNDAPSIKKNILVKDTTEGAAEGAKVEANKTSLSIGESVEYQIEVDVKAGTTNYIVHDKMDNALQFNGDVAVKLDGALVDSTGAYSVVEKADLEKDDGCAFEIRFDDEYIKNHADKTLVITYTATLLDTVTENEANKNTAYLSYGTGKTPDTPQVDVYSYKMEVFKYTGDDTPLAGAKFELKKGSDVVKLYKADPNKEEYTVEASDTEKRTDTQITTLGTGLFTIKGLGEGTYTLSEIESPMGYNKIEKPINIVITQDDGKQKISVDGNDIEGIQVKVQNNTGTILPSTGGIGTTIFYAVGIILMAGAVFFVVRRKKA